MRRNLTITLLLLLPLNVSAKGSTHGDATYDRFVGYRLTGQHESVLREKDRALQELADASDWEHYYFVATLAIQTRVFSEHQTVAGLRECRQLYEFALQHGHNYGRASVLAMMGWLYGYIGDSEEAVSQMGEAITLFRQQQPNRDIINIYYYYAYMLELAGNYSEEARILGETRRMFDHYAWPDTTAIDYQTQRDNLLNAETLLAVREGQFDRADSLVSLLEQKVERGDERNPWESLRAVAEYYLAAGHPTEALAVTDRMLSLPASTDPGLMWGLKLLRSDVLSRLGRSDEALALLRPLLEERTGASVSQMRRQLAEMESLSKLNEMRIHEQKVHFWYAVSISIVIIIALLMLIYYRQCAARQLSRKNEELIEALDHAQESDRMKTAFIQHISHEIRTPLNIITGFAQIVSNPDYDVSAEDRNRMLADISHNTDEITSFVGELLELSESESHSSYQLDDDVSINTLCRELLADSTDAAHGLCLRYDTTLGDQQTWHTNEEALRKILSRLMNNALKFTEQGSVTLSATITDAQQLVIALEDTGIGIPQEYSEKIFERFFKVDTFKQGIGLGLTVARRTAQLLGGTLRLDTSYKRGARFVLAVPLSAFPPLV